MDQQQVRFCTSADGTRIAYASFGQGPPLLVIQRWAMPVDLIWRDAEVRRFHEQLAMYSRVVTFDRRGQGVSERDVTDVSMDRQVEDALSVVDAVGLSTFDVFGDADAAAVGVELAARKPELVSRLVVWGLYGLAGETRAPYRFSTQAHDMLELTRTNWFLAANLYANVLFPSGPADVMHQVARHWARAMSGEVSARYAEVLWALDVREGCRRVTAPVLAMHRRGQTDTIEASRELSSLLRATEYVEVSGDIGLCAYDGDETAAAVNSFLRGRTRSTEESQSAPQGEAGTAVILFADIVDSTGLTERAGDAAFRERARALDVALREIINGAGGTAIDGKLLGDGVLATFPAAAQAIDAALRCGAAGNDGGLPLHLGIHAGDVIREQNNVFGGAVNIASRISGLSAPGEVLVSDVVRALARTSASVVFEDRGAHVLKGIADPQRVFAVRAR
jgi:class 3 adenylate cyclase